MDRADVDDYLQALIPDYTVWSNLTGMGWNGDDLDLKKTFDYIA